MGVFAVDASTSRGTAEWLLYLLLLFLASWKAGSRFILFYCLLCTGFVVAGYALTGPVTIEPPLVNRLLLIGSLWIAGLLLIQRNRAQEALAASKDQLWTVLQSIGDAVVATDRDGRIRVMNRAAELMTGWSLKDAAGRPLADVFSLLESDTRRPSFYPVARVIREGSVLRLADQSVLVVRDGSERAISDSGATIVDKDHEVTGVVLVFRDITAEKVADEERKRLHVELQETVERLTLVLNRLPIAVIINDPDIRVSYLNPAAEKMFGYTADEIIGKTPFGLAAPEDIRPLSEELFRRLADGEPFVASVGESKTKDGRTIVCDWVLARLAKPDGTFVGVISMATDITLRHHAEKERVELHGELEEMVDRLMLILSNIPIPVLMLDPDVQVSYVNPAAVRMFGYDAHELIGKQLFGMITPQDQDGTIDPLFGGDARSGGVLSANVTKDGRSLLCEWWHVPLRKPDGTYVGTIAMAQDVTERHRAAEDLRDSEARFRTITEHAPEAIVVLDLDKGTFIDGNPNALRLFSLDRAALLATNPVALSVPVQPDGRSSAEAAGAYIQAALDGQTPIFEWMHRTAVGRDIPCEVRLVRLPAAGKKLIRGSILDISARKRLEDVQKRTAELVEQNRLIHAASRLKSEFLANMSHELRTPLNAIIGFAELLHDERVGVLSDEQREFIGDILSSGRHLLTLINDVLDLAKVEAGKMEFHPEPIVLEPFIEDVTSVLRAMVAKKRIQLTTRVDADVSSVVLDPIKLKQVLYNYLSNAIKFTPDEGKVTLRVAGEGADFFRAEVEDTGIGISPEDVGKLFTEFAQLDASAAKKHGGTGLGLVLTKRIVEAQGGQVGVRSVLGKGSVFFAVLPRAALPLEPPEPRRHKTMPLPFLRTGGPSVLVIEDEPADAEWLARTLTDAGYAVEHVRRGKDALVRCRERLYDAITLDLLLPDISGLDVLRGIRADGPNRDTPIVVVTLVSEHEAVSGFPVQDVLVKPVQEASLVAALARAGVQAAHGARIVVVDDDVPALRVLEQKLADAGYAPQCHARAADALVAIEASPPAAVVLDLLMPEMDGFEFLRRLRMSRVGRRLPVLIWTVKDLTAEERSQLLKSAQAVLHKSEDGRAALLRELRMFVRPPEVRHGG